MPLLRRSWLALLVIALCGLHAWMAASVSRTFSSTADEIVHLTSGYAYWKFQDYRLQPENGNLPQRLAALPLLAMDVTFPPTSGPDWTQANVWRLGYNFFYKSGNDTAAMLAAGRAMIAILSALLCGIIFLWTRELFGRKAALLALVLAVFSPEFLAHGGLITSDIAAALGFVVALLSWWRLLQHVTLGRFLAAGLCVGYLAVSKHSVVLFAPMAVLLAAVRLLRPAPLRLCFGGRRFAVSGWRRAPAIGGLLAGSALVCATVIWSFYGFRYHAAPPAYAKDVGFIFSWETVLMENQPPPTGLSEADGEQPDRSPGIVQDIVRFTRDHRLLPEAWLYGLAFVEKHSRARLAYFAGEYRRTGWPEFFPVAFALKTTLPALLLIVTGVAAIVLAPRRRRAAWLYAAAPLLVLLLVYWAFSIQSKLNIGHRHLLPIYPACYILAGAALLATYRHRLLTLAVAGLAIWHVAASVVARPDYLAYFNPIAGGSSEAHRLFVDSTLDWGQDLPRLHEWLDTHAKGEKIFLSYFGSGSPSHEGITATRFGDGFFDWEARRTPAPLAGGVYCFSATMFRRVYTAVRGPWTAAYEARYQEVGNWVRHMARQPADHAPVNIDDSPMSPEMRDALLGEYEQLQFGRLCHFLQFREPDARATHAFLIFRLNDDEIAFALRAPLAAINTHLLNSSPDSRPAAPAVP